MKTVSIGYHCACNDFAVLATLNNNDGHLTVEDFEGLVGDVASTLCRKLVREVVVLERQDTPDYVEVEQ
tara:strand:- start:27 stop:233 length:207 start_codon:yes stop_codon:yes gene_type:complete